VWTHEHTRQRATITIRGFDHLSPQTVSECQAQAVALLDFVDPDRSEHDVRVVPGG
jgi:hypothetical protein